jgi:predicted HD superfamily hydrolase involved in NAD metabolism
MHSTARYSAEPRTAILTWLNSNVPPPRLRHIVGVEQTAEALAQDYGLDAEKAAWAGLLHDLAKYFPPERLLAAAEAEGLALDPLERADPHLLHADVSAIVARDRFGVEDADILNAVRHHTLGSPGMSPLSCIVFIADALEPHRGNSEDLQRLRQLARTHLYEAVVAVSDFSLKFLLAQRKAVHPRTILTRNWFLAHASASPRPVIQETVAC